MVYCSNCGTQNRDGSKFCNNCGSRLASGEPPTPPKAAADADTLPAQAEAASDNAAPATPPQAEQASMDLPEWLRRLRAAVEADNAPEAEQPPAESEPPLPPAKTSTEEWLSLLRENPPQVEDQPSVPPQKSDETPDWIQKLSELASGDEGPALTRMADEELRAWREAPPAESTPSAPEVPAEQEPSFLGEIDSNAQAEAEQTSAEQESHPAKQQVDEDLPSWLREISEPSEQEPAAQLVPSPEGTQQESPFDNQWIPGAEEATDDEIPAWIKRLRPQEVEEQQPLAEPDQLEEEQPQVQEPAPEPQVEAQPLNKPAILPEDVGGEEPSETIMPDWLRLSAAAEQTLESEPPAPAVPEIEPARPDEVPSWVAALKPQSFVETGNPPQGATPASNPVMEGLPGVLPLAVAITEPHFTGDRPAKVEAPKGGHLFESILAETPPVAEPVSPTTVRRKLTFRPLIYLALLLAVLIPFLLPNDMAGYAIALSDNSSNFYGILRSVPANGIVVISFDYEPSLAGEMDLQANAIVSDLVSRNVRIVAVSTLPTGPQVAQRVLDNAVNRNPNYGYGTGYVNYGYIAGQEAGLLQLATNGFNLSATDFAQRQTLGKYSLMANLGKLNDARLIIELAGSEAPLKMWMEQAQPRVPVQIVAGVSAALEPRAQTYLNAKQLSAYVAGLMDAARLEVLRKDARLAVASANALTWAMVVLVVVIVIGNLVYWGSRLRGKVA